MPKINETISAHGILLRDKGKRVKTLSVSGSETQNATQLPLAEDCPVTFLGYANGKHQFLGPDGHSHALSPAKLGQWSEQLNLFGIRQDWLLEHFPPSGRNPSALVNCQKAAAWLMHVSRSVQDTNVPTTLKQSGVWPDPDHVNKLLIHLGSEVVIDGNRRALSALPTQLGFAYSNARIAWPAEAGVIEDALRVRDAANTFQFASQEQRDIFLGWIGPGFFAGALKWRPHVYVTAPRGSGKSLLIAMGNAALGALGCAAGQDASAAYLRQSLNGRACAILIDEAEGGENGKVEAILELARCAADGEGAFSGRGTPGGIAQQFTFAGPIMLAGIQAPILAAQDRTRIAQLSLKEGKPGTYTADALDDLDDLMASLKTRSGHLLRYMTGRWPIYRQTEKAYRWQLQDRLRTTPRFAMQAAALLAGYDTLLFEEIRPDTDLAVRAREMLPALHIAMTVDEGEPGEQVLQYLAAKTPMFLGLDGHKTVAGYLQDAIGSTPNSQKRKQLRQMGLDLPKSAPEHFMIANINAGLEAIFAGTQWTNGRWQQPLKQLPDISPGKHPTNAFGGSTRVLLVPLGRIIGPTEDD